MSARIRFLEFSTIGMLLSALFASAVFADAPTDVSFDVGLRGAGSATIHASVFNNPQNRGATTILAVHGLAERGSMFAPLASAIFADPVLGFAVRRIVAIDLPAHGDSSAPTLPSPLKFSDLTIEDNVSVVIQSIDKLQAARLGAQVIIGHSMGGLAVQAAQETLLTHNSSLAAHGIFGAILLSAVPARGAVWTMPPPADVTPFIVNDPVLGVILDLPSAAGPQTGAFTTLSGTLAPNTPSVGTFIANDWIGPEPITTLLELTGTSAPLWRPFVRQNAFDILRGTVLTVISASQDVLTPAVDQDDLYTYLTGVPVDPNPNHLNKTLYRPVVADDAVHSMYISNPTGLLSALRSGLIH